jgi:hypothetical protein
VILDGKVSAQLNPSNRLIGFTHWSQKYTRSEGGQFNQWGSGIERCCPPLRTHVDMIEWEVVRKSLVRLPNINVIDIRADKSFVLPNRQRMTLRVNMFNVMNANAVTSRTVLSGGSYLRPTGIPGPRIFEFVASYDF